MRLIVFLVVIGGMVLYIYMASRPKGQPVLTLQRKPKTLKPPSDEMWTQVYDTDSLDEARKIRLKFQDMSIQCFVYEQGKKDVYGTIMKHYGISVPRKSAEKAQTALSSFTL